MIFPTLTPFSRNPIYISSCILFSFYCYRRKCLLKEFGCKNLREEWLINWCLFFFFVESGRKGLNTTKLILISILNDLPTRGSEKRNSRVNRISPSAHWGVSLLPWCFFPWWVMIIRLDDSYKDREPRFKVSSSLKQEMKGTFVLSSSGL